MEENKINEKPLDPQEIIARLKKLIESIKNKQNSKKNGNEFKATCTTEN